MNEDEVLHQVQTSPTLGISGDKSSTQTNDKITEDEEETICD